MIINTEKIYKNECKFMNPECSVLSIRHKFWAWSQVSCRPRLPEFIPCRVGSVGSVSASCTVGREFASRPGHTKDDHKNGTNCLPAWHAMR